MKKSIISLLLLTVIFIIFFSIYIRFGIEVKKDDVKGDGRSTFTMTAKEHNDDISVDIDEGDGFSLLYNSLGDGDLLIILDTISDIYYDISTDITTVKFEWIEENETDHLDILFEGDIINSYQPGDEVKISVTIKYVTFSYKDFNFEMEIYEEQWESEDYYRSNVDSGGDGFKPLPQSCIEKV